MEYATVREIKGGAFSEAGRSRYTGAGGIEKKGSLRLVRRTYNLMEVQSRWKWNGWRKHYID